MGGPEMAPHTPPSASRSSLGLDRSGSHPTTATGHDVVGQGLDRSGEQRSASGEPRCATDASERGVAACADAHRVRSDAPEVPLITHVRLEVGDADLSGRERDTLVLTAEERRWGRRRVTTTGGRTLALALPTGSVLVPGAILHVGPDWFVVVECATEQCLAVTPASREEALRVAFEVGNRHFTLALDGARLLVLDDPGMDILLARMGVRFERVRAVFVPIGRGQRHDR